MKKGADAIRKPVHAVIAKKNLFGKETMCGTECVITSSITAGITVIEVPERDTISIPTKDVLAALNLANARYNQIREQERSNPLVEEQRVTR
jgi:hypothetical protein|uniref:hypothetical protein n=1 Tax=Acetatifactor sp. TaxID=1872090 RepID=UPI002063C23C|nr:MAG TPA: hypothetical protein [Caudoviricetes sp.]